MKDATDLLVKFGGLLTRLGEIKNTAHDPEMRRWAEETIANLGGELRRHSDTTAFVEWRDVQDCAVRDVCAHLNLPDRSPTVVALVRRTLGRDQLPPDEAIGDAEKLATWLLSHRVADEPKPTNGRGNLHDHGPGETDAVH